MFRELVDVAKSAPYQEFREGHPQLGLLQAQAWIELGHFSGARSLLEGLLVSLQDQGPEWMEATGLMARLRKQMYLDLYQQTRSPDQCYPEHLGDALNGYWAAYQGSNQQSIWHAINVVSLTALAGRHQVTTECQVDIGRVTQGILDIIGSNETGSFWNDATAGEAYLARGELEDAERYYLRALFTNDITPFALAGAIRQLMEVWGLTPLAPPGDRLLRPLQRKLVEMSGKLYLAPQFVQSAMGEDLATVFGQRPMSPGVFSEPDDFMSPATLLIGLKCCRSVARVEKNNGEAAGTGFVLPESALMVGGGANDQFFLVTNYHVVGHHDISQFRATFYGLRDSEDRPFTTALGPTIVASSPPDQLDYMIIGLAQQPQGLQTYNIAKTLPKIGDGIFSAGHPLGASIMLSIGGDNRLLDCKGDKTHSCTGSLDGSSGSPLFDNNFQLVGVMHAGGSSIPTLSDPRERHAANEGILIQSILTDARHSH